MDQPERDLIAAALLRAIDDARAGDRDALAWLERGADGLVVWIAPDGMDIEQLAVGLVRVATDPAAGELLEHLRQPTRRQPSRPT